MGIAGAPPKYGLGIPISIFLNTPSTTIIFQSKNPGWNYTQFRMVYGGKIYIDVTPWYLRHSSRFHFCAGNRNQCAVMIFIFLSILPLSLPLEVKSWAERANMGRISVFGEKCPTAHISHANRNPTWTWASWAGGHVQLGFWCAGNQVAQDYAFCTYVAAHLA